MLNKLLQKKFVIPTLLFAFAAVAQVGINILFSIYLSKDVLGDWALMQSILFIACNFILLGSNQAIVRFETINIQSLLPLLLLQYGVLSLLVTIICTFLYPVNINFVLFYLLFFSFSLIEFLYGFYHQRHDMELAQMTFALWRVIFLVLASVFVLMYQQAISTQFIYGLLLFSFLSSLFVLLYKKLSIDRIKKIITIFKPETLKSSYQESKSFIQFSLLFLMFALTLNAAMYLDQSLPGLLGYKDELVIYFVHLTIIAAPFAFVNRLGGFFFSSFVKKNQSSINRKGLLKIIATLLVYGFIACAAFYVIIPFIFDIVYKGKYELIPHLSLGLLLLGWMRLLYIIPSSFLGMLGSQKHLYVFLINNVIGMALQIGLGYWGHLNGYDMVNIAIVGVLLNTAIRLLGGMYQVFKIVEQ